MDMVIDISNADKGFLILVERRQARRQSGAKTSALRNLRRVSQLSDAIIAKVVEASGRSSSFDA